MYDLRTRCNKEELWAHDILDRVKVGLPASQRDIQRALWVLGDTVGGL